MGGQQSGTVDTRAIRVFISSTFRDMQLERDELVKRVFPRIRKLCEQRGVAWSEVDLRWGVTDEQKAEGDVLPICLAEIERTRPYFIGLLGQRYGWVPDEIPADLSERMVWLAEDRERSVTEMEILYGVLRSPEAGGCAYFYLRDPEWVESLPAAERDIYLEESETGRVRLAELRERVRASGHPVRSYPDPVALGDLVLADLTALVDERYPESTAPSRRDHDAALHRQYAVRLIDGFVARPALTAHLDAHLAGEGSPLLVTGEPGAGSSALVAAWAGAIRDAESDRRIIEHFVGADAAAADPGAMIGRLVAELDGRRSDDAADVGDDPVAWRSALRQAFAAGAEPTLVVIDGVEALDDAPPGSGGPDLRWLPANVPAHVRVVIVSTGERPREQFAHRGWPMLEVPPLDPGERRELAATHLARSAKALDAVHLDALAAAERTGNARYLRIVLDELRQHGDHFTLGDVIARLCAAATVEDLYELVLARYESDFERDRPGLTRDVFSALGAARQGLTESELLELMGVDGESLPQAVWSPLHLAAEEALVDRNGLIGFANPDLRHAVDDRYLADDGDRRAAHARLAAFFTERDLGPRVIDELAWQQIEVGDTAGLAATLADLDYTEAAYARSWTDLRRAWARAAEAGTSMVDAYAAVIDDPAAYEGGPDRQLVWGLAKLLSDAGHPAEALRLRRFLLERARQSPEGRDEPAGGDAGLRGALLNYGADALAQGRLDDADEALGEAVDRCRIAADDVMLCAALGNLAMCRRDRGDRDAADAMFVEEAELCRQLDDELGLQASLGNRAQLLREVGRFDEALALLREQEHVCRDLADDAGIARALAGQAAVLADRGEVAAAIDLTQEHVASAREQGDVRGLAEALLNITVMHSQVGDLAAAGTSAAEAEELARRLADPGLLARVLVAVATLRSGHGDWPGVERVAREAELTARNASLAPQLALALGLIGTSRREQGDLDGCRAAHTEELMVARAAGDPQAIAAAHVNLGNAAIAVGSYDDALAQFATAEPMLRDAQNHSGLLPMLANRAQVHQASNRFAEAASDYVDAAASAAVLGLHPVVIQWGEPGVQLAVHVGNVELADGAWRLIADAARATGDDARHQMALGERALVLIARAQPAGIPGDPTNVDQALLAEAARLLDEQEALCRRLGHAAGLTACIGNRAIVLRYQGDLEGALAALDEQVQLATESGDAQGALFATANRGEVLGLLGRIPEALEALQWARATAQQYGLAPMVQQLDAMIAALPRRS